MTTFATALRVQIRVVKALMLRETRTLFGRHKLGYLWAFIHAAFMIVLFWVIRDRGNIAPPFGMSVPLFLVAGFIPWFLFSDSVSRSLTAVKGNRALLAYPQVFPLDLLVARILLIAATYFCVMLVILGLMALAGLPVTLDKPASILLSLIYAIFLGLGMGMICSALNALLPATEQIVPMLLRILFFTSGTFFSVSELPDYVQKTLFYNPVSHIIEMLRAGFSASYPSFFVSDFYVFSFVSAVVLFGLLLERYSRNYIDRET